MTSRPDPQVAARIGVVIKEIVHKLQHFAMVRGALSKHGLEHIRNDDVLILCEGGRVVPQVPDELGDDTAV